LSSAEIAGTRRPGAVTFIGVIILIQATLAAVAGVVFIAFRNSDALQEATNQTQAALTGFGVGELVVALLYGAVGAGILGGSRVARFLVVFVQLLGAAFATYVLLVHHSEGTTIRSLVTILIAVFVVWALYGHKESDEYFMGLGL
jgi:peptidoglycan/LPS O-acetylase OafA/YrhL